MQLDMFNIDDFVRLNHVQEVKNPIFFQANKMPTPDGLLSYDIFGYSEEERKNIFGYIDLRDHYIHPVVYSLLANGMSTIKSVINGEKYAVISNGKITAVPEGTTNSGTGLEFLYENYERINWINEFEEEEISSLDKKTRLKFLRSLKKDEFFVTKWLVIPPFYREESAENRSLGDVLNQLYKDLISATKSMKMGFGFDIFGNQTRRKIQGLIKQIYDVTMGPISGKSLDLNTSELKGNAKNSLLKRHLVGKTLDYGVLTVITAPQISDAKDINSMPIPFGYAGVTIPSCVALFKPFFIHEVGNILEYIFTDFVKENSKIIKKIDHNQFSSSAIDKILTRFVKSSSERFDPIVIEYTDNNGDIISLRIPITEYYSKEDANNEKNGYTRPLTYMDLIFIAANDCLKDKHVLVTRHPVTNNKNIYPAKVKVLSTARTREVYMYRLNPSAITNEPVLYKEYPYIYSFDNPSINKPDPYYEIVGTSLIGNAVLKSLGGDYDGDTVFLRGLFSIQANQEAAKMIKEKSNVLGADGSPIRGLSKIGKDCTVAIYELTKD